RTISYTYPF
nr:Chain C, ARG-THR-ILE-SER-TYR-THR-TYR-PRO-PHE [Canine distemper virus strain Onderstepoort]7CJQ_F Chain F, ARG-THR-ILE-SER-TYR-THR-TYR-PRO-PHE [Canine distemper virus strain Onderstepoort]